MTNETMGRNKFTPAGLLDIAKQIKTNRKSVDDLEDRLHSALDAKRDVASDYVEQLDSITEKEVEVKLDPFSDLLQTTIASNTAMWKAGYDEGFKAGSLTSTEPPTSRIVSLAEESEQRDRELLESHGIDVDGFCDDMVKMIKDHEQDIDEDEPDQYPANYGGTK